MKFLLLLPSRYDYFFFPFKQFVSYSFNFYRNNMLYLSGKVKKLDLITLAAIVIFFLMTISFMKSYYEMEIRNLKAEVLLYRDALDSFKVKMSKPRYPTVTNYERKDYHNYEFMQYESSRTGPGEQGQSFVLTEPDDIELNKKLFNDYGFYAVTSDKISVNRSLPDIRHQK